MMPLLAVQHLNVVFETRSGTTVAVDDLSFDINHGETLAIVGESGSGKSVTALSIMRLIEREGGRIANGQILLESDEQQVDIVRLRERQLRALRGATISMVFQEPMTSLNPAMTVGRQLIETISWHNRGSSRDHKALAIDMFERVQLDHPDRRLHQFPHELSGGMRQRVMIAMALVCRPRLLIADEPTTALDVTLQAEILQLLHTLTSDSGAAVLFITHDMGVVSDIANRVVVMRHGRQIETATRNELFGRPKSDYTKTLLAAAPRLGSGAPLPQQTPQVLLKVRNLVTRFYTGQGILNSRSQGVTAVNDVSFDIHHGETLGLVGESGSGKSTIGRSVMKLLQPTSGTVSLDGKDLTTLSQAQMKPLRRHIQMVFQDPYASLNPRKTILDAITEPLIIHKKLSRKERHDIAVELIRRVDLPASCLTRYPHQFSGGQRQRISIARALSVQPKLIIADEPVSALDVSVQAQVLELMEDLQQHSGIAFLFISHDIAVVERMSHRVIVLRNGSIVEHGETNTILNNPQHDYTRKLLDSVPGRGMQTLGVADKLEAVRKLVLGSGL